MNGEYSIFEHSIHRDDDAAAADDDDEGCKRTTLRFMIGG